MLPAPPHSSSHRLSCSTQIRLSISPNPRRNRKDRSPSLVHVPELAATRRVAVRFRGIPRTGSLFHRPREWSLAKRSVGRHKETRPGDSELSVTGAHATRSAAPSRGASCKYPRASVTSQPPRRSHPAHRPRPRRAGCLRPLHRCPRCPWRRRSRHLLPM